MRFKLILTLIHVPLDLIGLFEKFKHKDVKTRIKLAELFFLLMYAKATDFLL